MTVSRRDSLWASLRASAVGLPRHLAWVDDELPRARPWIFAWQRATFFLLLPVAVLAIVLVEPLSRLGLLTLPASARVLLYGAPLLASFVLAALLCVVLAGLVLARFARRRFSWNLAGLLAYCVAVLATMAWGGHVALRFFT